MFRITACLIIPAIFLSGCSLTEQPGPVFAGRFIVQAKNESIYEIKKDPATNKLVQTEIARGEVLVSPDKRYLLLNVLAKTREPSSQSQYETILKDLKTGEEKKLFSYKAEKPDWSPDSKKISYYYDHQLLVSDLAGNTLTIYKEFPFTYDTLAGKRTVYFPPSSALWVGSDRLIFQSVLLAPDFINVPLSTFNKEPDTTNVIAIENAPKLTLAGKSIAKRFFVGPRCLEQGFVLFGEKKYVRQMDIDGKDKDDIAGSVFIARHFNDFAKTELRPVTFTYRNCDFVPNSCRIRCFDIDEQSGNVMLDDYDPVSFQKESHVLEWKGRNIHKISYTPEEKIIAVVYSLDNTETSFHFSVVDIRTGGETVLIKQRKLGNYASNSQIEETFREDKLLNLLKEGKFLAWLPE